MIDQSIKNAKQSYIESGRLNRNLINKEVAISWYKCKLQNMKLDSRIKILGTKINNHFDNKFISFIDSIVPVSYQYILVNTSLQKCSARISDQNLSDMDSIDDLSIGTNGGYLSFKTLVNQTVSLEEHYLQCMTPYYSSGQLIMNQDKLLGVLMLLSEMKPNEYDLIRIREKLESYNNRADLDITNTNIDSLIESKIELSSLFAYPEEYYQVFKKNIEKMERSTLPILIKGSKGSGKSTLAHYLALKKDNNFVSLNLNDIDLVLQKSILECSLYQNETVIIDNLQDVSQETLVLLTVYNDEITASIASDKPFKYKCLNLILTIDYNELENVSNTTHGKQLERLINKLSLNTVNLVNTSLFLDNPIPLIDAILNRNQLKANDLVKAKLKLLCKKMNFKEIQSTIAKSVIQGHVNDQNTIVNIVLNLPESIETLEANEKNYVLKIYDLLEENMSATAEVLKIGRSTLYRKLNKYQNDTIDWHE